MKLSVVIPAYNEEQNIGRCLDELRAVVCEQNGICSEFVVVNDNSTDGTEAVVRSRMEGDENVRVINRDQPGGFGRAVRTGLEAVTGEVVVICMADLSDDPRDVVAYYRKIQEGYDCVFGSRFIRGSVVENYPRVKLFVNRIVNHAVRILFRTKFNDLTNAFKAYRTSVIRECGPFWSSHFNITLELSLSALIRRYNIAEIPIRWYGRTWGASNLRLREMGRRYLCTVLTLFFQRMLINDDLMVERLSRGHAERRAEHRNIQALEQRIRRLEEGVLKLVHDSGRVNESGVVSATGEGSQSPNNRNDRNSLARNCGAIPVVAER
ncbi:MAG: glycosyltransferase family 2 protein [Planctomycetaceae bacterium]